MSETTMESLRQDEESKKEYVNEALAVALAKVQQLKEESLRWERLLNVKQKEVCERVVVLNVLKMRQEIMLKQKQELEKEKLELEKEKKDLQRQYVFQTDNFCELTAKFHEQYKRRNIVMTPKTNTSEEIFGFDLSCIFPKQKTDLPPSSNTDSVRHDTESFEIFINEEPPNECFRELSEGILETSFDMDI